MFVITMVNLIFAKFFTDNLKFLDQIFFCIRDLNLLLINLMKQLLIQI